MIVEEVIAAFRDEERNLAWDCEVLERLPLVTRRSTANGQLNFVMSFGAADIASIEAEIEHFSGLGLSFEWKVFSFDSPPNLVELLAQAGYEIGEREALVVYDLRDGLAPFEGPFECEVVHVATVEQLADFRQVAEAVFNKDYSLTTNELADAIRTGRQGHDGYVAYIDGAPVSVGRLYTNAQSAFAGLYGGGTLASHRGRGCYRALIAARAQDAAAAGARYLQVDALPTSLPILLRLGFRHIADTWPCTWSPPAG